MICPPCLHYDPATHLCIPEVAGLDPRNRKRDRGQDGEAAGYAAEERMGIFIGRRCALHLAWEGKRLS
jgi:hypothetical protein